MTLRRLRLLTSGESHGPGLSGILDGLPGLVFCTLQGYSTFMKWALLWNFELDARRGREPRLPAFGEKGSAATADDEIVPRTALRPPLAPKSTSAAAPTASLSER